MNKTGNTNRVGFVALMGVILGMGILFGGCGQQPETETVAPSPAAATPTPVATTPAAETPETPAQEVEATEPFATSATQVLEAPAQTPVSADPLALTVDNIGSVEDVFRWAALKAKYEASGQQDISIESVLATKEKLLLPKESVIGTIGDVLDLAAFDWRVQDEEADTSEGVKVTSVARWLFRCSKSASIEAGQKALLVLRFRVDKAHERYFAESSHPSYFDVSVTPAPSVAEWEAGGYYLVERHVTAPVVPYQMSTFFSVLGADGKYVKRLGGDKEGLVELGWKVCLPEEG